MFAVEARIFNNGNIVSRVREAKPEDQEGCSETRTCDIWIDLFDDYQEALTFKKSYKSA